MNETTRPAGLAEELRTSIARLSRGLRRQGHTVLSGTQFSALAVLERHGEMTPRELADHEQVQPPSMTRTVASLEARALIVRRPHQTDRRQVVLTVTEAGRELLTQQRRLREAWLSQRLAQLSARERAILEKAAPILEKLSRSL